MFVTLFCAFLDVVSGRLAYANGGHCAPFLAHEDRAWWLPMPKGALVGAMPGRRYEAIEVGLHEAVALVCYTDGITEAESAAGEAFSAERLLRVGAANCRQPMDQLLHSIEREVSSFVDGMPLADDSTLFAVRRPAR